VSVPLLATKLHIPPVRPDHLPRRHLIDRIDEGLQRSAPGQAFARKLTLVSAPAGFGKTTLLAEWAAHASSSAGTGPRYHPAWLSLDEADNAPVRFLTHLIAALQTVESTLGADLLDARVAPRPLEESLAAWINQVQALASRGLAFALVLDDYQLIVAQAVHDLLAFLLDHLPGNLHLILATRADPPLSLARLRGRGQLTELRQADLRFHSAEAADLLNRILDLGLSSEQVATLTSRTEGWIAGLQMASLALQSLAARPEQAAADADALIQSFSGTHRYVLDYLLEEVLQRQPEQIQAFLLFTSILDRLTAPLCDAVLSDTQYPVSTSPSQQTLDHLESANLFLLPLDAERRWYRYHRLFADLLRRRLFQHVGAAAITSLHQRASVWYEGQGLLPEAIDHALSASEYPRAAALIEQAAGPALMRSEVTTFLGWVEFLPQALQRERPTLCLYHAWALLLGGRSLDAVEARLQEAGAGSGLLPGQAAPLRAFVAACQGQIPHAVELSRQALAQLPEDEHLLRGIATWNLGVSYLLSGQVDAASHSLEQAAQASQRAGNLMVAVMALCALAELRAALTELPRARDLYARALDLATVEGGRPLPVAGLALIGLGELHREWNDHERSARFLEDGIECIQKWGKLGATDGYLALARLRQAQGDPGGAREAMHKARQLAAASVAVRFADSVLDAYQARLWLAQGDLAAACRWAEDHDIGTELVPDLPPEPAGSAISFDYHVRKHELLVWVRLLILQDRPAEALAAMEPWLAAVEQRGGPASARLIELQILRALALQVQGELEPALQALARALSLAEPGGYVRLFLDEGEPMLRLLRAASAYHIAPEYVHKLLSASEAMPDGPRPAPVPPPSSSVVRPSSPTRRSSALVEPLTQREAEVLQLLATHLTSTEIAERLHISPHTARYHIKNIYGKLGVHRRTEAVERARELELL
jgi:LuxR family maltose regulon positive regulatory protein